MGDLFDEFMRELERRRAEAEGRTPPAIRRTRRPPPVTTIGPGPRTTPDDSTGDRPAGDTPDEGAAAGSDEPTPIRRRSRTRAKGAAADGPPHTPRAKQPVGGPDDGAGRLTIRTILRRVGIVVAIVLVAFIVFLAGTGIDLWTDAIWYKSVGFDSVFWTRIGAQVGLFLGALAVALVVLLFNLCLAGRLAPPPDPEKPGRLRQVADRLTEAQRQAERTARMGGGSGRPAGGPFPGRARADEFAGSFDLDDIPDLVPIAKWVIAGVAIVLAIGIAGAVSGAWTTVLLWINRVPFSPDSAVVRPGLRPRHQLLPVRPAVPPLRPVAAQRPAAGRRCWSPAPGTWRRRPRAARSSTRRSASTSR